MPACLSFVVGVEMTARDKDSLYDQSIDMLRVEITVVALTISKRRPRTKMGAS